MSVLSPETSRRDEVLKIRSAALEEVLGQGACPASVSRLLEADAELRELDKANPIPAAKARAEAKPVRWEEIAEEQFEAYRRVQAEGKYNMITDASFAMAEAGLDMKTYFEIVTNYGKLAGKYGSKED